MKLSGHGEFGITLVICIAIIVYGAMFNAYGYVVGNALVWAALGLAIVAIFFGVRIELRETKKNKKEEIESNVKLNIEASEVARETSSGLDSIYKSTSISRDHNAIRYYWEQQQKPMLEKYYQHGGFPNEKAYDMLMTSLESKMTMYYIAKKYSLQVDDGYTDEMGMGVGIRYDYDHPRRVDIEKDLKLVDDGMKRIKEKYP